MVRVAVERTLNKKPEIRPDEICNAQRYERCPGRMGTLAGDANASCTPMDRDIEVSMPRLLEETFETAVSHAVGVSEGLLNI